MSFGISVSDIALVIKLAKDTVAKCRKAPSDFAEASRVCQSLYLMLEAVEVEAQNPDSPLYKDVRIRSDFAIHMRNCESALEPLANLVSKYTSLESTNVRLIDRLRFSKKDYLEYRGNLSFYTSKLAEFLQMVGLGSLGRIEQKVEHIKENLPRLMLKIDQMCADLRINGDKQSLLSDHTDDEKFVWKIFRRKLNDAGFTSHVLREHEAEIFLRIRELTDCGLLVADTSSMAWSDQTQRQPDPEFRDTYPGQLNESLSAQVESSSKESHENPESHCAPDVGSKGQDHSGSCDADKLSSFGNDDSRSEKSSGRNGEEPRVWRNINGKGIVKGALAENPLRGGNSFVAVIDKDNEEVLIPCSNLDYDDLAYVQKIAGVTAARVSPKLNPQSSKSCQEEENQCDPDVDENILPNEPERLVGKRTQGRRRWYHRQERSTLPTRPAMPGRASLTSDALPQAAARGDFINVKRLLAHGQHIECKGPESWTETISSGDNDSKKRHSFPETTALFRAAEAGWIDIVHFLILNGADVDTRDGYDGRVGEPILFRIIRRGDEKMARLLLEYEAAVESRRFGATTALHIASSYPKVSIVKLILNYDAYIDARDSHGKTPLYLASDGTKSGGFARNVELLLREGAKLNIPSIDGQTALYKASGKGRDDIVELLLKYGGDPDAGRGRHGETTLFKAAWLDEFEVVQLLLNYGADVNLCNESKMRSYRGIGEKIIHGMMAGVSQEHAVMNNWGKTALHAAAYKGNIEIVQILLTAGADPEVRGKDGLTPLYVGATRKHEDVVQLLLKSGAKLNSSSDPVLAMLEERNRRKSKKENDPDSKSVDRRDGDTGGSGNQMDRLGTDDKFVGLVANFARTLTSSRRGETAGITAHLLDHYLPSLINSTTRPGTQSNRR